MPTYQYRCTDCGASHEVVQAFADDPLAVCPTCQGRLRKIFSAVGVVFKGSGFYKTDSRGKPKPSAPSEPKKDGAGGETKKDSPPKKKADAGQSSTPVKGDGPGNAPKVA